MSSSQHKINRHFPLLKQPTAKNTDTKISLSVIILTWLYKRHV